MEVHNVLKWPAVALALGASCVAVAADPASGELTEEVLTAQWTGGGPYVFPNLTPTVGDPVPVFCDPTIPQVCDQFTLNVNISDEFRDLEENQRESVKIGITFPDATGQEDYDLYVYDSAGALVGESAAGAPQTSETVTVPLKTLKNGAYTVTVIPYTPLATNYDGVAQVGKGAATEAAKFSVAPLVGSAPLTVSFDARALSAQAPAGGYVFTFGDGTAPVTDADGVIEHTYTSDGRFQASVRFSDSASGKALGGATQTLFVGPLDLGVKSGGRMGGALGAGLLLALAGLGLLGRRRMR